MLSQRPRFRIPRPLLYLGLAAFLVGTALFLWVAYLAVQVGLQVAGYLRDAPQTLLTKVEEASADPSVLRAVERNLACVELLGGPSASRIYEDAVTLAPSPEARERLESLGKALALPRPAPASEAELLATCVYGTREKQET